MSNFTQIEPFATPDNCIPNDITFQYHNNSNSNSNSSPNLQQLYPGMVNRVCNVFGMKPEDYNTKLITETFYSNYLKKRRSDNDNTTTEHHHHQSFASNNAEKKRKYW
ncbi:hypothetical protein C6P44_003164 [Monosporozyma unispora]|nr:hypothetical protein C6P44_003164 [Kazachstania unispora]